MLLHEMCTVLAALLVTTVKTEEENNGLLTGDGCFQKWDERHVICARPIAQLNVSPMNEEQGENS